MQKKTCLVGGVFALLITALLNVLVFFTLPEGRTELGAFWLSWIFTFPVCLFFFLAVTLHSFKKGRDRKEDVIIYYPLTYRVVTVGTVAFLAVGFPLMYLAESVVLVAILNGLVTVAYAAALYLIMSGLGHISEGQKYTQKKILFIRLLESDLESCYHDVKDPVLLRKLQKLAENIRFSDPMSHATLASCENELTAAVFEIVSLVKSGKTEEIDAVIAKVQSLLDYRNSRCKLLK